MATRTGVWAVLGLLILTGLLYSSTRSHGYVYEDANWLETSGQWPVVRIPGRAVAVASHVAVGLHPDIDHAVNVALHLTNGALVAGIAHALGGPAVAVGAALVFLLHPLNSAAVAYLTARTDLLMTFGILLAVWASLGQVTAWRWGLVACGLLLAAASKEIGMVGGLLVALTVTLWGRWPVALGQSQGLSAVVSLMAISAGAILGSTYPLFLNWLTAPAAVGGAAVPWGESVLLQNGMVWHLLTLVAWPVGFSIDHDVLALSPRALTVSALLTLAVALWLASTWRKGSRVAWALAWVALSVGPRFVVRTSEFITEPQLYLPMVGISVLAGSALAWLWSPIHSLRERTA